MNIQRIFAIELVLMLSTDNLLAIFLRLLIISKASKRGKTGDFTVSKPVWSNLSFEDKCAHLLMNCNACMKKANYEKSLQSSRCETKICNKKLQKAVFTGTEWSLLADITNILVKTLNSSFKKVFNKTFASK